MPNAIVFAPVVENTPDGFFPEHPIKLLSNQYNNNVPIICGVNQEDGGGFVAGMYRSSYMRLNMPMCRISV